MGRNRRIKKHISFRLEIGNKRDQELKDKLKELKKQQKKSFNSLLKDGIEMLCRYPVKTQ